MKVWSQQTTYQLASTRPSDIIYKPSENVRPFPRKQGRRGQKLFFHGLSSPVLYFLFIVFSVCDLICCLSKGYSKGVYGPRQLLGPSDNSEHKAWSHFPCAESATWWRGHSDCYMELGERMAESPSKGGKEVPSPQGVLHYPIHLHSQNTDFITKTKLWFQDGHCKALNPKHRAPFWAWSLSDCTGGKSMNYKSLYYIFGLSIFLSGRTG